MATNLSKIVFDSIEVKCPFQHNGLKRHERIERDIATMHLVLSCAPNKAPIHWSHLKYP